MALAQYSSELDCLIEATRQQVRQDLLNNKVTVRHREDKSVDLLDLCCPKTFWRSSEVSTSANCVAWPAEHFLPSVEIILMFRRSSRLVLFDRILRVPTTEGAGDTFVLP